MIHNKPKACVILPTYNERENIAVIIPAIFDQQGKIQSHDLHVLVVDDNSPDGTQEEVKRLMKQYPDLHLLTGEKKGLGEAYKRGMDYAINTLNSDLVFEMDADFQHDPSLIPLFISLTQDEFTMVIGSRFVPGGSSPDFHFWRKLLSFLGNWLIRFLGGLSGIHDCTSGYRCINAGLIKKCDFSFLSTRGYSFQPSFLCELIRNHARVIEIPITFSGRQHGRSKLSVRDQLEFLFNIPRIKFNQTGAFAKYGFVLLFLLLFGISQIPLWSVRFPPLVDYPNHLARMHIISRIHESNILQTYYSIHWQLIPNLAMDVVTPLLSRFMPLETAGKVFISLIFFLMAGGTMALHYALHRRISFWPLFAFVFLYNRIFLWGLLNYLFGVGLLLFAYACWIYFEKRSLFLRLLISTLFAIGLFFSHLFALGVYGLCIIGHECYKIRHDPVQKPAVQWVAMTAQFVIPAILLIFFSPTAASSTSQKITYGDFSRKVIALVNPILNYDIALDIVTVLVLAGFMIFAIFKKQIRISNPLMYPLALLVLAFAAMPTVMFSAYGADVRIPIAFAFLAIAAIELESQKFVKIAMILLLIVFSVRLGFITKNWQAADKTYAQYVEAFEKIEEGSRLFSAIAYPGQWTPFPIPVTHFSCIAVIQRSAFVPSLFAYPTQQPLEFADTYKTLAIKTESTNFESGKTPDWEKVRDIYDYALITQEHFFKQPVPQTFIEIFRGDMFRLYRVRHHE